MGEAIDTQTVIRCDNNDNFGRPNLMALACVEFLGTGERAPIPPIPVADHHASPFHVGKGCQGSHRLFEDVWVKTQQFSSPPIGFVPGH